MKKNDFNHAAGDFMPRFDRFDRGDETERYSPTGLMFKNRIILVAGQVDTNLMVNIVAQLKHLEAANPEEPITMLINSPGGSVIDGLAIVDVMREVKCPILTVGNGMQASMGSILLAAGDERRMTKNAKLLIHQIMGGAQGGTQHTDFEISAAFMAEQHENLKSVYVEFTGLNHKFWDIVGERDTWLSAEQAMKIGYIHSIVKGEKPAGPYADEATRPVEEQSSFKKDASEKIAKMPVDKVIEALGNGQANEAEWGRYRPELVTRLAEFPQFWTAKKREEMALRNPEAANQNVEAPVRSRKRNKGQDLG